jgi:serine/threonine protein kinase
MGCGASAPAEANLAVAVDEASVVRLLAPSRPALLPRPPPLATRKRSLPPRRPAVCSRLCVQDDVMRDTPQGMPHLDERLEMRQRFKTQANKEGEMFPKTLTQYDIIGLIGEGATARVYLCEPQGPTPDDLYAMKVICKADVEARGKKDDAERERKLLQLAAGHPFVLNAHACFDSEHFEFLVLDHCPGSDLFEVQGTFPNQRMPESAARFYFMEVMLGCECIHDLGFVIRDLKPENVLIDSYGHCRVSDFDLAIEKGRPPAREPLAGTAEYISPEILKTVEAKTPKGEPGPDNETCNSSAVTEAADVWVLGLMLFEMLHGYSPFSRRANESLAACRARIIDADNPEGWVKTMGKVKGRMAKTKSKKAARTKPKATMQLINISGEAKAMISTCLAADPAKRPRVIGLRHQKWFKGIDWKNVTARELKPPWVPEPVTESTTELLRASSKAEQTRRGSIDRPGWAGHSVLDDQQRESSRLSEQSSLSDTATTEASADPPRVPSRISGDSFEEKAPKEGKDATHEMMIAMYALKFAAKTEDRASVGTAPVVGSGRFLGVSYREDRELEGSPISVSEGEEEAEEAEKASVSAAPGRPRGLSEPTTTMPPTTSPVDLDASELSSTLSSVEECATGGEPDSPIAVPQRRKPSEVYTSAAEAAVAATAGEEGGGGAEGEAPIAEQAETASGGDDAAEGAS